MKPNANSIRRRSFWGWVPILGALAFLGPMVLEVGPSVKGLLGPLAALAILGFGLWLLRKSSAGEAAFDLGSSAWRLALAAIGSVVLGALGFMIPEWGLLWSPLPGRPYPYHRAMQIVFWLLAPPLALCALRLLDIWLDPERKWTARRAMSVFSGLVLLIVIGVVANAFLWAYLNHGQGG